MGVRACVHVCGCVRACVGGVCLSARMCVWLGLCVFDVWCREYIGFSFFWFVSVCYFALPYPFLII